MSFDLTLNATSTRLEIHCESINHAQKLWRNRTQLVADLRHFPHIREITLCVAGRPFLPTFNIYEIEQKMNSLAVGTSTNQVIDFVINNPNACEVTSMITHRTLLLNDKYEPGRLIWKPAQLIGFNCLYYWQDSMDQFSELLQNLQQTGESQNFRFLNRRTDGTHAEFVKDYFLVEDFFGDPARVSVSREWRILDPI